MKNHKEMMEALLAGEYLIDVDGRSANEYWLDKQDGRIYYRNTKEDTFPCKCSGIPNFGKLQVKPKTININGFDVPEPLRVAPGIHELYWLVEIDFMNQGLVDCYGWDNDSKDQRALELGIIHLTKEAAELHAKALLSFTSIVPKESKCHK